jgi:hypothetical protein
MSFIYFTVVVLLAVLAMDLPGVFAQCSIVGITGNTYSFSDIGILSSPSINPSGQSFSFTPCGTNYDCDTDPPSTACVDADIDPAVPLNDASDTITFTFVNPLVPQLGVVATYPSVYYGGDTRSLSVLFACGSDDVGFAAAFGLGNLDLEAGGTISLYAFVISTSVICDYPTTYPVPGTSAFNQSRRLTQPRTNDHLASNHTKSKLRRIISAIRGGKAA